MLWLSIGLLVICVGEAKKKKFDCIREWSFTATAVKIRKFFQSF